MNTKFTIDVELDEVTSNKIKTFIRERGFSLSPKAMNRAIASLFERAVKTTFCYSGTRDFINSSVYNSATMDRIESMSNGNVIEAIKKSIYK